MKIINTLGMTSVLLLAGCASFSPDGGLNNVREISGLHQDVIVLRAPEDVAAARAVMDELLQDRLTTDEAVRIALLNNRELQAAYNTLGISEAELMEAKLPPNPLFTLSRIAGGGTVELEAQIAANILGLATMPSRTKIADERFRLAQLEAADTVLRTAANARRAWYRAVAARELAGFIAQARATAETSAELSKRLGESGAINKIEQADSQVFYAELTAQLASARQNAASERETLIRALGLWGEDLDFKLPAALPALPKKPQVLESVEADAIRNRLDVQMARIETEALAKSYGLMNATRFIDLLEVSGIAINTRLPDGDLEKERGFEAEFEVPLFDFGGVKTRKAEETYMRSVNLLTAKAVNARSEAREAYQTYRSAHDIARHYQNEVLPLRKIISDETMLRYGAMQVDVFALLTEERQRMISTATAVDAKRDFWLADVNLGVALHGGGVSTSEEGASSMEMEESAGGHD